MSKQLRRLILIPLLCLSLFACVANKSQNISTSQKDYSRPSYSSIYYYMVASYFRAQQNFTLADVLLQKALSSDPGSFQVKKQFLLNSLKLHQMGEITDADMHTLLAESSREMEFDADILSANYIFYEQVADTTGMKSTVRELQERFPNARAYIQRFIFEMKYMDNADLSYLNTALQLAQNDPQSLYILSNIYYYYDKDKEMEALLRYHAISPTDESHAMMASRIIEKGDLTLARNYIDGLDYPAGRDYYRYFADEALRVGSYDTLVSLESELLDTGDLTLINAVGFSALLQKRPDILERIALLLPSLPAPDTDKQAINALLIAHSIHAGYKHSLTEVVAKLSESQYFDDVFAYFNFAVTADTAAGWMTKDSDSYALFSSQISSRLQDEAPARYLLSVVSAVQDSTSRTFIDAKFDLIQYLKQRHEISAKDYEYLLQYYYSKDKPELRRSLLEEALTFYPDNAMFCNDLGYTMLIDGADPEAAAKLIRRALENEPDNLYYQDSLAWYYYLTGQFDEALETANSIINLESIPAEIAWHLGEIYLKANDFKNARIYLEKCIVSGDDPAYSAKAEQSLKLIP